MVGVGLILCSYLTANIHFPVTPSPGSRVGSRRSQTIGRRPEPHHTKERDSYRKTDRLPPKLGPKKTNLQKDKNPLVDGARREISKRISAVVSNHTPAFFA
jgi:hypothetical protein